jgi:hypothetical protein
MCNLQCRSGHCLKGAPPEGVTGGSSWELTPRMGQDDQSGVTSVPGLGNYLRGLYVPTPQQNSERRIQKMLLPSIFCLLASNSWQAARQSPVAGKRVPLISALLSDDLGAPPTTLLDCGGPTHSSTRRRRRPEALPHARASSRETLRRRPGRRLCPSRRPTREPTGHRQGRAGSCGSAAPRSCGPA